MWIKRGRRLPTRPRHQSRDRGGRPSKSTMGDRFTRAHPSKRVIFLAQLCPIDPDERRKRASWPPAPSLLYEFSLVQRQRLQTEAFSPRTHLVYLFTRAK